MRRLNVREAQIDVCIRESAFALPVLPQDPSLEPDEVLLLQLVKSAAQQTGNLQSRINFALIFDHYDRDYDGSISRKFWPSEGRTWEWIIYGSATVPTIPFSLDSLNLSRDYQSQNTARWIDPEDEAKITPFILWSLAQVPVAEHQLVLPGNIAQTFGSERALSALFNHDRIELSHPTPPKIVTARRFERNQALSSGLKSYYNNRCQVCGQDFIPQYGVEYSETHHIQYLSESGLDISSNIIVLCPNHHRIVHETGAQFDRVSLTYEYPNGLVEPLLLDGHFSAQPEWLRPTTLLRRVAEDAPTYDSSSSPNGY
jgi:hypothetical protein